ncbi:MAG: FHA domain-containing protein [Ruminococcus sp.]|nr:FHA domain-containing protein [Ruminococcus sp.]
MNLVRCMNGHFYDAERFDDCPHCNQTTIRPEDGEDFITRPISPPEDPGLGVEIGVANGHEDEVITRGYFGEISSEPVVGWLVCIEGNHFGEDFKLKTGKNFIGRSSAMDVVLSGDASVSRDRHAIVVYEPKSNIFLVQPGDSKELFYVNDEVVLSAQKIKGYDVLSVGDSKLLFIPCCSDRFNWDAVKNEEK